MATNDSHKPDIDPLTGVETTGHSWDGIKELENPLPKWWSITYLITIAIAAVYLWLYPSFPIGKDSLDGSLGYTERQAVAARIEEAKAAQSVYVDQIASASLQDVAANAELVSFAARGGQAAFNTNCAGCHAVGGGGLPGGYPVLADDDWLWGGDLEAIYATIQYGVRSDHDEARYSEMPAFGADDLLTSDEINQLAAYVLSLSEGGADPASDAGVLYADNCASCHGEQGEGLTDLGAPNLRDFVWLYGGELEAVAGQIAQPKHGVMPAFVARLDDPTIRMLALYVHGLGGGQ